MMKQLLQISICVTLLIGISGCGFLGIGKKKDGPVIDLKSTPKASVVVTGTTEMNRGNRVKVVVFQLAKKENFMASSRQAFWTDENAIKEDFANVESPKVEFELEPGNVKDLQFELGEDTRFIGVAADVFRPTTEDWRTVREIVPNRSTSLRITIDGDRVSVE